MMTTIAKISLRVGRSVQTGVLLLTLVSFTTHVMAQPAETSDDGITEAAIDASSDPHATTDPVITLPTVGTLTLRGDFRIFAAQPIPGEPDRVVVVASYNAVNVWSLIFSVWPEVLGVTGALVVLRLLILAIRTKRETGAIYCRRCNHRLTEAQRERCPECGVDLSRREPVVGKSMLLRIVVMSFVFVGIIATMVIWNRFETPAQRPKNNLFNWSSIRLRDWAYHRPVMWMNGYRTPVDRVLELDVTTGMVKRTWFNEIASGIPLRLTGSEGKLNLVSSPRVVSWDVATRTRRTDVTLPKSLSGGDRGDRWIAHATISPDGRSVFVIMDDGEILRCADGSWERLFAAGSAGAQPQSWLVATDRDRVMEVPRERRREMPVGTIRDLAGQPLHGFVLRVNGARQIAVTPDGSSILVTDETQTIEMRSLKDGQLEALFVLPHQLAIALSPVIDDRLMLVGTFPSDGSNRSNLAVYDRHARRVATTIDLGPGRVRSVHPTPDMSRIVVVFEQFASGRQVHQIVVLDGSGLLAHIDNNSLPES